MEILRKILYRISHIGLLPTVLGILISAVLIFVTIEFNVSVGLHIFTAFLTAFTLINIIVPLPDHVYKVKAKIEQINAFSAHADYTEMTSWLDSIDKSRLKNIFLVHGEQDAQAFFTNYLHEHGYPNVTTIKYGEEYEL